MDNPAQAAVPPTLASTVTIEAPPKASPASASLVVPQVKNSSAFIDSAPPAANLNSTVTIDPVPNTDPVPSVSTQPAPPSVNPVTIYQSPSSSATTPPPPPPPVAPIPTLIESALPTSSTATPTPQPQPTPPIGEIPIATPNNQAKAAVPSIDQMEQDLRQSGELAGQIILQKTDPTKQGPLADLQPDALNQQQHFTEVITTPETESALPTVATTETLANTDFNRFMARLRNLARNPLRKLIAIGLTLQGLRGIGQSVRFILIDYPMIEQQLLNHNINQSQVNEYAIGAILLITSTVLSMFFALRLTILQSKTAKHLNTFLSILLVIGNQFLHDYLTQFDLARQIGMASEESISTLQAGTETFLTRFLKWF